MHQDPPVRRVSAKQALRMCGYHHCSGGKEMAERIDKAMLSAVIGGASDSLFTVKCPDCGSTNVSMGSTNTGPVTIFNCSCRNCGKTWNKSLSNNAPSSDMF